MSSLFLATFPERSLRLFADEHLQNRRTSDSHTISQPRQYVTRLLRKTERRMFCRSGEAVGRSASSKSVQHWSQFHDETPLKTCSRGRCRAFVEGQQIIWTNCSESIMPRL